MTTDITQRLSRLQWRQLAKQPLALVAAAVLVIAAALLMWTQLSAPLEQRALAWLQDRQTQTQAGFDLATVPPKPELTEQQALVVSWLSRKYRVAHEPLALIVAEAFEIGAVKGLDPALILSVAANESRFNPLAQSPVGAQGLMQVLTRVHTEKFDEHGGVDAAFDPLISLWVGSQILQDTIRRTGSVQGGLRRYVGAVTTDGRGYIQKVLAEQLRLQSVMAGKKTPFLAIPPGMPDLSLPVPELVASVAKHEN